MIEIEPGDYFSILNLTKIFKNIQTLEIGYLHSVHSKDKINLPQLKSLHIN
jgi:hypothetical protein